MTDETTAPEATPADAPTPEVQVPTPLLALTPEVLNALNTMADFGLRGGGLQAFQITNIVSNAISAAVQAVSPPKTAEA